MMRKVSIVHVRNHGGDTRARVVEAVREAMEKAEWRNAIHQGSDVSLKPNLCFDYLMPGVQTSPWVLEGVVETIRGYVGRIYVVEADTYTTWVERGVRATRILDVCRRYDLEWINMSKGRFVTVPLADHLVLGNQVEVPEILTRTQLITVPVLKTHCLAGITGAIKNQWGCLRRQRLDYHAVINRALADLNAILKPQFCVMDGTVCLEGRGPKQGRPRVADLVMASADNVALDAVAARVIGLHPDCIEHIQLCAQRGSGVANLQQIEIIGEWTNLHFEPAKKNLVALLDIFFRRPFFEQLLFHTPLFVLVRVAAISNYVIWMGLEGRKHRDHILHQSRYGAQWLAEADSEDDSVPAPQTIDQP
ncbi:MAG TPA: DUF362 domain-containing protein [Anaerolineae bacterium]|nr:DUF362 domain-containing protein [Anaerolineae bacterium]